MRNCSMTDKLQELHDGRLVQDQKTAVEAHVRECADCRKRLEGWKQLSAALNSSSFPASSEIFVQGVMDRIEAKGRTVFIPRGFAIPMRWFAPALAAAAVLLLALFPSAEISAEALLMDGAGDAQWAFAGAPPKSDDMLGFIIEENVNVLERSRGGAARGCSDRLVRVSTAGDEAEVRLEKRENARTL